jgi:DNA-binding IclR family transcriptional regulator
MVGYREERSLIRALAEEHTRISVDMICRRIRIPRPAAKRLLRELEWDGVVGPPSPGGSREVLIHA